MPRDEHAVACRHEVGFYEIRAVVDRARVGGDRVFGKQAACAAMRDHDGAVSSGHARSKHERE